MLNFNKKQADESMEKIYANAKKVLNILNQNLEKKNVEDSQIHFTRQVFSEVYDIIYNTKIDGYIPKGFIELIDSCREKECVVNIDYTRPLSEQKLQKGTRVILALIYREYIQWRELE